MIIGGQAMLLYGDARLTNDIDVTLGVDVDNLPEIMTVLKKIRLKSLRSDVKKFVEQTLVLPAIEEKSGIRVDFIFSNSLYEHQALKRAKTIRIHHQQVRFASVEDVIIQKIIAARPTDIEDTLKMMVKQTKLNTRYIRKWLGAFEDTMNVSYLSTFNKLYKKSKH